MSATNQTHALIERLDVKLDAIRVAIQDVSVRVARLEATRPGDEARCSEHRSDTSDHEDRIRALETATADNRWRVRILWATSSIAAGAAGGALPKLLELIGG